MLTRRFAAVLAVGLVLGVGIVSPAVVQAASPLLELVGVDGSRTLELTSDDLAAMPQTTVVTQTDFSDGTVTFTGPLARDVLAKFGLDSLQTVRFTAANDYYVDIPTDDFRTYDVILAMTADGKPLSRRDKGPLWLIYPISDHAELSDPSYLRRLIWQVVRIEGL